MNCIEKYRIKKLLKLLNKIYNGNREKTKSVLNAIENNKCTNGWIKIVYLETKKILEAEIDLNKSNHILHVINLLNDVIENDEKKEYMMYEHPSWYGLIQLRSPFEFPISIRKCCDCEYEYPFESIGDFADIGTFNCSKCNKVLVGTLYASNEVLECKSEGKLVFNKYPKCYSIKFTIETLINPYKYFSSHIFINKLEDC